MDAGEGEEVGSLLALATSVNVCCGLHAGDAPTMAAVVAEAGRLGCAVGAHPSYPDREGFGRRALRRGPSAVEADVLYQVGALGAICRAAGVPLRHLKPHGALYHAAWRDQAIADAIARAASRFDTALWVYAPPSSALERAARAAGLRVAREGFADRGVQGAGLVARGDPGGLLTDPAVAAARALRWAREGRVMAGTGEAAVPLAWPVDTLCVHGDTPGAAALLAAVRDALRAGGIAVGAPGG